MTDLEVNGKAVTIKKFFSRQTDVSINIDADKSIIWALLTNADDYPRWNSTVISIEGNISRGEKIKLKATLDPKRVFKLLIKEAEKDGKLVWGDGMGNRTFSLKANGPEQTNFSMSQKIEGPFFPLFSKLIPSFDQSFEQFANDLKKEAELIQIAK